MENKYAHSDFDSFYLEYSPKLWRLAYRLTRNRYDSEDLVDEAFLIYLQKSTTMVIDKSRSIYYSYLGESSSKLRQIKLA